MPTACVTIATVREIRLMQAVQRCANRQDDLPSSASRP